MMFKQTPLEVNHFYHNELGPRNVQDALRGEEGTPQSSQGTSDGEITHNVYIYIYICIYIYIYVYIYIYIL